MINAAGRMSVLKMIHVVKAREIVNRIVIARKALNAAKIIARCMVDTITRMLTAASVHQRVTHLLVG